MVALLQFDRHDALSIHKRAVGELKSCQLVSSHRARGFRALGDVSSGMQIVFSSVRPMVMDARQINGLRDWLRESMCSFGIINPLLCELKCATTRWLF